MSEFNLDGLSCETLRRRLSSNTAIILRDQSLRDSLDAQIRRGEILLDDKNELGQVGKPPLPSFPDPDSRRRGKRPRAGLPGPAITVAELAVSPSSVKSGTPAGVIRRGFLFGARISASPPKD